MEAWFYMDQGRKYLVDTVTQGIRDATDDGPADFPGCHFPKFGRGHVRIESGVRSAYQIGNFFQRTFNKVEKKKEKQVHAKMLPKVGDASQIDDNYLGTRCTARSRGRRGRPLGCDRLSVPEPVPIHRRDHLEQCSLKRRPVSSAWWCTRWSSGGCARSTYSAETHNPIERVNPAQNTIWHNSDELRFRQTVVPVGYRPGSIRGNVQCRLAGKDRRKWRWNRKL